MNIVMDTNIASTFGKIERFDLLQKLFPSSTLFISSAVDEELSSTEKEEKFTKEIRKNAKVTSPNKTEEKIAKELLSERSIGKAEAECIAIAKHRKMLLLTNDNIAVKEARKAGADVMDIRAVIRELWRRGILQKEEVEALITEIEEKDNIIFADKNRIFE